MRNPVATLAVLAVLLVGPVLRMKADEKLPRYDAVELNKQLIGNELLARSFQGKTIEVTGNFYGTQIVKPKAPGGKEAVIVTFQGYAGLGECGHIRCIFFDAREVVDLKRGQKITVRGKATVARDVVGLEGQLVK